MHLGDQGLTGLPVRPGPGATLVTTPLEDPGQAYGMVPDSRHRGFSVSGIGLEELGYGRVTAG